ncbi:MAG: hypothetical protein MUP69_04280 [Candidatus Atribacteria bacterium]|nr:hypothetical protein [Candidatus Atribacteria bacterium]
MKFKRIIILTILILTILSLFVSAVHADFSDGFKTGFQIGMQIRERREMKWKEEQLKILEAEKVKRLEQWKIFIDSVQKLIDSGQMTPELEKKFWVLNSLLLIDWQEHEQNLFDRIMSIDKDKVAEEKQYFKNTTDTISLTGRQVIPKTFDSLTGLLSNDRKIIANTFMEGGYSSSQSELKFNPFQNKWEYAPPNSSLKFNPFESKWEFAMPDESVKLNSFENKWEFASPEENTKYNPFENKWSYESDESSLKYNAFENKWEYAKPGSILKYNPFSNSWSYE